MNRLRVALETQFTVGTATGLGTYARGLRDALRARDDVELIELRDKRFDLWRFDRRIYWDQVRAPRLARAAQADIVHFTGGTLPLYPPRPVVLTLHDLVWLRPDSPGRGYTRAYFGALQGRLARRADALIVDTNAARAEVAERLGIDPARIHVAGAGVDDRFFSVRRRPAEEAFALCVGTVERRKDLVTAVRAAARVPGLRLIAAGPFTPYVDEVRAAASDAGAGDRVRLLGYVDDDALLDLYARAALLLFPSRYEGFGLPPLQALACGVPVVAAGIPATQEVLGDCAHYAEPGDVEAFARLAQATLGAPDGERLERGRRRAGTFTWASVAERVVPVYRAAVSRAGSMRRAR